MVSKRLPFPVPITKNSQKLLTVVCYVSFTATENWQMIRRVQTPNRVTRHGRLLYFSRNWSHWAWGKLEMNIAFCALELLWSWTGANTLNTISKSAQVCKNCARCEIHYMSDRISWLFLPPNFYFYYLSMLFRSKVFISHTNINVH